jgi:hypothetical protein
MSGLRAKACWGPPAASLALALIPRLWQIDLTLFFNDQVWFLQSVANFIDKGQLPLSTGLDFNLSATGAPIREPPLTIYVLALPSLISRDPAFVSGFSAVLDALAAPVVYLIAKRASGTGFAAAAAAALYALNPAAIVFGRMFWNPDFVPLFAAVGLLGLIDFWTSRRSLSLGISLFAIGCAAQFHVANLVFFVPWLLVALLRRQAVRFRPLIIAGLGLLLTAGPYLYLQVRDGWSDVIHLVQYAASPKTADVSVVEIAGRLAGPNLLQWLMPQTANAAGSALNWLLFSLAGLGVLLAILRPTGPRLILSAWLLLPLLVLVRHTAAISAHAAKKPAADYTVFVHILDGAGRMLGQDDGIPQRGAFPTTMWQPGDVVDDVHELGIEQRPGLSLEIGLYTRPGLQRVPALQPGKPAADHVLLQL